MKKNLSGGISMVLAVAFLGTAGWTWGKKEEQAQPQTQQAPAPAASTVSEASPEAPAAASEPAAKTAPSEELEGDRRVVHKFGSQEEMKEFLQIWQQRQAIMMRMAVLQAYWNEEQNRLTQVNNQLTASYQMDLTKRYVLEDELMHLIELKDIAEPEPSIPAGLEQ